MSVGWNDLSDDDNIEENPQIDSFFPGSFQGILEPPQNRQFSNLPFGNVPYSFSESTPIPKFMGNFSDAYTFAGEIEEDLSQLYSSTYYSVQFHPNRSAVFKTKPNVTVNVNDYVLTEADRGIDIGKIISIVRHPNQRDIKNVKYILRVASPHEISQLPEKAQKEEHALELCRSKAAELGLPMEITGAELQFDGKKLSFYYTASAYVDFRNLVKCLFRLFGTRIWMVWYDGHEPVHDVHNHIEQSP